MYILKNAIKSITRNKGRNLMIMIIALVIALSACVSLSIREAAETAKEDTLKNLSVTAQLSFDRTSLMKNMNSQSTSEEAQEQGSTRQKFDFSALSAGSLTLDDYMGYAGLLSEEDGYYYTLSASLNAGGDDPSLRSAGGRGDRRRGGRGEDGGKRRKDTAVDS